MGENSPKNKYLRPESGVFCCSKLDESQFKALTEIVGFIEGAVHAEKQATKKGRIPPWLNLYRKNQVVLLHGDRGVGKTSVLLSIIYVCTQSKESYELECGKAEKQFTHFPKKTLDNIRDRLVWLEPLDMDPLPGPTNLLAAILARIEEAVQLHIPQGARGR